MVQLLILTGQRRGELAGMEWGEVDLKERLWTIPRQRTKNNRAHEVPLSAQVIALLKSLPQIGERFVFTTNGEVPASDFGKKKRILDGKLPKNMPKWTLHDLRRSTATGMQRIGVDLATIEKVLNHTGGAFGGIVGVYQQHDFREEKHQALTKWGRHVAKIAGAK